MDDLAIAFLVGLVVGAMLAFNHAFALGCLYESAFKPWIAKKVAIWLGVEDKNA
jgi:hypothetical protein